MLVRGGGLEKTVGLEVIGKSSTVNEAGQYKLYNSETLNSRAFSEYCVKPADETDFFMFHPFPKGGGKVTLLHAPGLWMEIIGGSTLGYLMEGRTVLVATKRGSCSRWEMQMRSYWKTQKREQRYWKPGPRARKAEDSGRRALEPPSNTP